MTSRSRRLALAAALGGAGLLAAVLVARDEDSPGPRTAATARSRSQTGSEPIMAVEDLRLEVLEEPRATREAPLRNPFRFEARPAPRPSARTTAADGPVPPPAVPQSPGVAPPGPPPIPLRYIGLVEAPTQAGRVAIVSDGRGNVFYGKEGDIIEGRYRLVRIGPDSLELSYLDGRGRQTIRLSGQ